jgi:PhoH-like ATPase
MEALPGVLPGTRFFRGGLGKRRVGKGGRSLPQQFIIIDEAQNLTPHEVKTIVTRAGEGTKIVFTGDPYQIDHPYLDSTSNGLTHLVERFRDHAIAAHVTLSKGERSKLAELASVVMEE